MSKLKVLDLFSGIGGFSLGLERTGGFETVAFCEIEEFPRKVLVKHWPEVPCYHDVRELTAARLAADGIAVDVICGGFPCQDISTAGKGAGIHGERSGLWREYARLIDEIRPQFAIMENVSALLSRGLDVVLGNLAEIGFDAEWHCIPASAIGAPHRRDRVWIMAYPKGVGYWKWRKTGDVSEANGGSDGQVRLIFGKPSAEPQVMAHPDSPGLSLFNEPEDRRSTGLRIFSWGELERARSAAGTEQWEIEPNVGRVANGVPNRVDRLKALGNAVVPQIPELIGNAILASMSPPLPAQLSQGSAG